jgi:hypothetical protein
MAARTASDRNVAQANGSGYNTREIQKGSHAANHSFLLLFHRVILPYFIPKDGHAKEPK